MQGIQSTSSPQEGRFLIAQKQFAPGQVVLCNKPYDAVLYDEHLAKRCAFCFEPGDKLMRCSMSKVAHFCSKDHHRLAWANGYKEEAQALSRCQGRIPPATLRLCARVLWRKAREAAAGDVSSYQAVAGLLHHWELLDDSRKATYAQMAVVVRQYMLGASSSTPHALPDTREVALLLARFACNNHTMCDEELRPYGVGLYPLAALANHSCRPTCMQSFAKGSITFRALQHLQPGDPITISYIELAATRRERRENLQYLYFFDIDKVGGSLSGANIQAKLPGDESHGNDVAREMEELGLETSKEACDSPPGGGAPVQPAASTGIDTSCCTWQMPNGFELTFLGSSSQPSWSWDTVDKELTQVIAGPHPKGGKGKATVAGGLELCLHSHSHSHRQDHASGIPAKHLGGAPGGLAAGESEEGEEDEEEDFLLSLLESNGRRPQAGRRMWCWGTWAQELDAVRKACAGDGTAPSRTMPGPEEQLRELMAVEAGRFCCSCAQAASDMLRAEELTQRGELSQAIQLLQSALSAIDGRNGPFSLGPSHLLRQRINSALLKACVDHGQSWQLALSTARALVPPFRLVYPFVWPNLGLHWAMVAKLENLVGEERQALEAAEQAARVMGATHPDSPLLMEQLQLRHDLQRSLD